MVMDMEEGRLESQLQEIKTAHVGEFEMDGLELRSGSHCTTKELQLEEFEIKDFINKNVERRCHRILVDIRRNVQPSSYLCSSTHDTSGCLYIWRMLWYLVIGSLQAT